MDVQRTEYKDWKEKNEDLLLKIKKLEYEIDRVQKVIDEKQQQFGNLEQLEQSWIRQEQLYDAYDTIFEQLLTPLQKQQEQQHKQQRREVSAHLLTSTALLCHKIERCWHGSFTRSSNKENTIRSDGNDIDDNDHHSRLSKECQDLERDIQKLMTTQNSIDYFASIDTLLRQEIQQQQTTIKEIETHDNQLDDKLDYIKQQQKERLHYIMTLEQETSEWENRVHALETRIREQARTRYDDSEVQEAFMESVLAKATVGEESSRLSCYEQYVDEVKQVSIALEEKHGNLDQIQKETTDILKKMSDNRNKIKSIQSLNQQGEHQIRSHQQDNIQLIESIGILQNQLKDQAKEKDEDLWTSIDKGTNSGIIEEEGSPISQIGKVLDPYCRSTPNNALSNLKSLLLRLQHLSSHQKTTISRELEALTLAWTEELQERGIPLVNVESEQDALDTVIHAVNALQVHVDNEWDEFVHQQEAQLSSKIDELNEQKEEWNLTRKLLDERNTIIKGNIGSDYTVQERNLEEWFQLLDQM
ncbi:uncharacterized protein BX664DRAFT_324287 [Halteromyces radiatus]|uniref:uncharacterized protein n=1 Tax=Halteromyces radiatus TaxID=101107 RepID=UPI0022208D3E|nr:uncharacterized protein BX664DRAFT_324287 [Halteromyces radiatus]KAI8096569.1 hypothetical protein BX664DRAFT_324287 [Halteromyces radiatus]